MGKNIQFKSFKMDAFDPDTGIVEGYASTYGNPDKVNDVVMPGAFKTALLNGPERVRFLWEHDRKSVIGVISEMREDETGLHVKAQFANTQKAQETRDLMKMGAVDSFSIGYRVLQESKGTVRGKSVNMLKEIQLLEVSCVAWPCNVEARMTAIKSDIEDRFDKMNLEQQALVGKFIEFLEGEEKAVEIVDAADLAADETTIVEAGTQDAKSEPADAQQAPAEGLGDLAAILDALELASIAGALRDAL